MYLARAFYYLILLIVGTAPCSPLCAKEKGPFIEQSAQTDKQEERKRHLPGSLDEVNAKLRQVINQLEVENAELKSSMDDIDVKYRKFYYEDFMKRRAELQIQAFTEQQYTTRVLTALVVILCLSGVIFSAYQLKKSFDFAYKQARGEFANGQGSNEITDVFTKIEISKERTQLTTSFVGLAILVISLVYMYLYLKDVYKINMEKIEAPSDQRRE
ncbi:MAG: hypothetical protein ACR65X_11540 [Methylocystis sp.]